MHRTWEWRPDVTAAVLVLGAAYIIGWFRLRRRTRRLASEWKLALYCSGLATIGVALLSPLARLASVRFVAHMIQHELLLMVAPALLLLSDPFPIALWGLPATARKAVGRCLVSGAAGRRALAALTWMPSAWLIYTGALWVWHLPAAYDEAVRAGPIHDLEHLVFFATGVLFWWPVISPAPRLRPPGSHVSRIVYVVLAHLQNALLGLSLMLAPRVLYRAYAMQWSGSDPSPLDDQAWGGLIMWAGGGAIHMLAVLVLIARLLGRRGGGRASAGLDQVTASPRSEAAV